MKATAKEIKTEDFYAPEINWEYEGSDLLDEYMDGIEDED